MSVIFHPLRVRSVQPDTSEAVIVSFEVPEELRPVFGFTQGQYLTRAEIDGQDLRRSYSICAGVDEGELRVGVRKVQGGLFSNWINEQLKPGDTINVMAPQGRFFVPIEPDAQRHHLGIAGGSGITPILSIMKTVLAREPAQPLHPDLRQPQAALHHVQGGTGRPEGPVHVAPGAPPRVLRRAHGDGHPHGRDEPAEDRRVPGGLIPAQRIDHAYICGPFQMNDEAEAALLAAGVPEDRIHIERFGIAQQASGQVGAVLHQAQPGDAAKARITIIRDGLKREIAFSREQPSILDAASAAGLEVPFSCTSGVCGTCRAKLVEGKVRMERNFALDKKEVAPATC